MSLSSLPVAADRGSSHRQWLPLKFPLALALLLLARSSLADSVAVFNEVMYHPGADAPAVEWLELHNQLAYDLDLSGWSLRGGVDFSIPAGTILPAGGYLVIAADPGTLAAAGLCTNAIGPFSGQLNNAGETLDLYDNAGRRMNTLSYRDGGDWPVPPDGSGCSLAKLDAEEGNDPENWHWSTQIGGTPGSINFPSHAAPAPGLIINEIAGATSGDGWLELINLATNGCNPAGCIASVAGDPSREVLITNTWLPPGGLLLIGPSPALRPAVDEPVFLYASNKTAVLDGRVIKSAPRALTPAPDNRWLRPASATPGAPNSFALETAIVINEIMYHQQPQLEPYQESPEAWVELFNRGTQTVDISGWRFSDGIGYTFPAGTLMPSGTYRVVAWDTNAFVQLYPELGDRISGPFSGKLSNQGERLRLEDAAGNPANDVHYHDGGRWPYEADGHGSSLELRDPWADNRIAEAWAPSDELLKTSWRTYTN
jgi:hypothetical protein